MSRVLFVDFESKNGVHEHLKKGINRKLIFPLYKKNKKVFNFFLKINHKTKLNLIPLSIFYSSWKKKVDSYEVILFTVNPHTIEAIKYIKRKNKNKNIICFYFNPISDDVSLEEIPLELSNIYTFDTDDVNRYKIKFASQVVEKSIYFLKKNKNFIWDIVFIGKDKGRLRELLTLESYFKDQGLRTYFYIVKSTKSPSSDIYNFKPFINYDEILKIYNSSKCILDFSQENQVGSTLRPLEALFLKKKLLTNNFGILNQPFFNKKNVLFLDDLENNNLKEFIDSPFSTDKKSDIDYYDLNNWLSRF